MDACGAPRSPTPCCPRRFAARPITALLAVEGSIALADITGLCNRVSRLLQDGRASVVLCDVSSLTDPDLVSIDALARMQLTAVRLGGQLRLRRVSTELRGLLALTGLYEILPTRTGSRLEVSGQTEQRKEGLGVEERVDRGYPTP